MRITLERPGPPFGRRFLSLPASISRLLLVVSAVALLLPGGVRASGTGVYEAFPVKEREQHLLETSAEFGDVLTKRGYLYTDPAVCDLVARIGAKLAPEPTDPYLEYRFKVLRNPLPNAFALPDGQVYVHTGMIAMLENEAQLATLLAHETNHSAGHHTIRHFRSARKKLIAGTVVSSVFGVAAGGYADLGYLLTSYVVITSIIGYGRDLEEEADRLAVEMVANAGYDVRESPKLFELLARDPEGEQFTVKTKWSSHPQLWDRAAYLSEMAAELGETVDLDTLQVGSESYLPLRRSVALITVEDLIRADYPRTAVATARRLVEEDDSDPLAHYALAESYRALGGRTEELGVAALTKKEKKQRARQRYTLTREERALEALGSTKGSTARQDNLERACESYNRALELDPDMALAQRGLGLVLYEQGSTREAGRRLLTYVRSKPDADDKAIILKKLEAISNDLKYEQEGGDDAEAEEE